MGKIEVSILKERRISGTADKLPVFESYVFLQTFWLSQLLVTKEINSSTLNIPIRCRKNYYTLSVKESSSV